MSPGLVPTPAGPRPQRRRGARRPRSIGREICSSSSIHMRNNAIVGTEADPVFSHVGGPWHGDREAGFGSRRQGGGVHCRAPARKESSLLIKQQNDRGEVIHFAAARRIANDANREM